MLRHFVNSRLLFFIISGELSEELILDVLELGLEFLSDLIFVLIVVLWLRGSLGSLSCEFKILLSSELALEDLLHDFLLLRL